MNKQECIDHFLDRLSSALIFASGPTGNHFIMRCNSKYGNFLKEYFENFELEKEPDGGYWFAGNDIIIDSDSICDHCLEFNFSKYGRQ